MYIISVFEIANGIDGFGVSKGEDGGIHSTPPRFPTTEIDHKTSVPRIMRHLPTHIDDFQCGT